MILGEKFPVARKEHRCTGSEIILNCFGKDESELRWHELKDILTREEYISFRRCIRAGGKIFPGEKYRLYTWVEGREFWTCKENIVVAKVLYERDWYYE